MTEEELINNYHVLILGALKRCHIRPHHPEFEDHLQTSRIVLIESYREFIAENKSLSAFHNYVYQRIYWEIIDTIRKEARRQAVLETNDDLPETTRIVADFDEETIAVSELIDTLAPHLTEHEKIYLRESYVNDLSIKELAKKYQVSRTAVYKWRYGVAKKYLKYFAK
ncbi:sigma-70 family RNA polymerase sigma factor [Vagococcus vulneris]|uniref:Sigma-70 family RNA polymerase sigma factor n=1 Tax=Vagococcus vulneris TaxID=1977869 RepID=A0A429ZZV0_9ENTE|nr:sigma-70 family RNA polymerase sigma factor [Vagococcus vulneris]RST99580.1 hypothetical protein CBF37_04430 [Vagococcus vulneris]